MKEKARNILCRLLNAIMGAGIILLFIGAYYWMIKAGIPYQDPSLELRIQYEINLRIGEILLGHGFVLTVSGGLIRLLLGRIRKKRAKRNQIS